MPCAHQSEIVAHAYYLQTYKLWLNEKKNEAEISTRAFPLESPSNYFVRSIASSQYFIKFIANSRCVENTPGYTLVQTLVHDKYSPAR